MERSGKVLKCFTVISRASSASAAAVAQHQRVPGQQHQCQQQSWPIQSMRAAPSAACRAQCCAAQRVRRSHQLCCQRHSSVHQTACRKAVGLLLQLRVLLVLQLLRLTPDADDRLWAPEPLEHIAVCLRPLCRQADTEGNAMMSCHRTR
jgi:hypothetical protein